MSDVLAPLFTIKYNPLVLPRPLYVYDPVDLDSLLFALCSPSPSRRGWERVSEVVRSALVDTTDDWTFSNSPVFATTPARYTPSTFSLGLWLSRDLNRLSEFFSPLDWYRAVVYNSENPFGGEGPWRAAAVRPSSGDVVRHVTRSTGHVGVQTVWSNREEAAEAARELANTHNRG